MKYWTDGEDEILRNGVDDGLSASEIAALLGRTRNSVIGRLDRLGIDQGSPGRPWSKEELSLLARGAAENKLATEVAAQLGRSPACVYEKGYHEGIRFGGGEPVTERMRKGRVRAALARAG